MSNTPPPSGIPYSHSRWMDMVDRRLHVLENRRPQDSGCCYAILLAEGPSVDGLEETWRVSKPDELIAPTIGETAEA